MAKKNFTGSMKSKNLSTLIPTTAREEQRTPPPVATPKPLPPQPKARAEPEQTAKPKRKPVAKTKPKSKAPATTVTSFRIDVEQLEQLKAIAYWERSKIQDIFAAALDTYFKTIPEATRKKAVAAYKKR